MAGDGSSLFRSVAHQVYGDPSLHSLVREKCADYMEANEDQFSSFIIGGVPHFKEYISNVRQDGWWGDDPEVQALSEIYNRPVIIWSPDPKKGASLRRTFQSDLNSSAYGGDHATCLGYVGNSHCNSIVNKLDALNIIKTTPGVVEDFKIEKCSHRPRTPLLTRSLRSSS